MMRLVSRAAVAVLLLASFIVLSSAHSLTAWKVVCSFSDQRLTEISGMARSLGHPGVLYVHNDSSGGPLVYAVDERTCRTIATLRIAGSSARDYEAIGTGRDARGRAVIWLGDIGDNLDSWSHVEILRVREPALLHSQTLTARRYQVQYADRSHNAETLLADPAAPQLWLVTKQLAHGSLYRLPQPLKRRSTAKILRTEGGLITDGAISPRGDRYVLRTYFDATIYSGLPPGLAQQTFDLPGQVQGEAVTWTADGAALLIASERDRRLIRVEIPQAG